MSQVVLLRGVNVGGYKTFRPARLAEELRHLGAINIGAAGTFVIGKPIAAARLRQELASRLPFETEIIICPEREFAGLLAHDWFEGRPSRPDIVRFVTVLARPPRVSPPLPIVIPDRGTCLVRVIGHDGRFVIGEYRRQMKAIGYLGKLDGTFGGPGTTRNWNTITAIGTALERANLTVAS